MLGELMVQEMVVERVHVARNVARKRWVLTVRELSKFDRIEAMMDMVMWSFWIVAVVPEIVLAFIHQKLFNWLTFFVQSCFFLLGLVVYSTRISALDEPFSWCIFFAVLPSASQIAYTGYCCMCTMVSQPFSKVHINVASKLLRYVALDIVICSICLFLQYLTNSQLYICVAIALIYRCFVLTVLMAAITFGAAKYGPYKLVTELYELALMQPDSMRMRIQSVQAGAFATMLLLVPAVSETISMRYQLSDAWRNTLLYDMLCIVALGRLCIECLGFYSRLWLSQPYFEHQNSVNKRSPTIHPVPLKFEVGTVMRQQSAVCQVDEADLCPVHECKAGNEAPLLQEDQSAVTNGELVSKIDEADWLRKLKLSQVRAHQLETCQNLSLAQAVYVRRAWLRASHQPAAALQNVPYLNYDYSKVYQQSCEQVVGYMPLPLGVAGPLKVNGKDFLIPLATTEGGLVAGINRGCKAVSKRGVSAHVYDDGMTRGPVLEFRSAKESVAAVRWIKDAKNFEILRQAFNATSKGGYTDLKDIHASPAGKLLYMRFKATTGEAMGMNVVSKGVNAALQVFFKHFPQASLTSVSGNYCTDKKPAAINWIEGRGKSVVCEALVPKPVIESILRTSVEKLVALNQAKNLVGSAMAGALGGFNAHAANVVAAMFIATGQDAAQCVTSSSCLTLLEMHGEDLYMSCTLPCMEVGTIGGGTVLPAQRACLELMGCVAKNHQQDPNVTAVDPVLASTQLALVIASAVLAAELNLLSELAEDRLVSSHMKLNRSHNKLNDLKNPQEETSSATVSTAVLTLQDLGTDALRTLKKEFSNPESCVFT